MLIFYPMNVQEWDVSPSALKRFSADQLRRVAAYGTDQQRESLFDWAYSGCSAAFSEELREWAAYRGWDAVEA